MKYKKYPSYKDSGVEWLGEIPSDWNESRLKFIGYTYGGLSGKAGKDFGDEENLKSKRFIPFTNIANNTFIKSDNLGYVIVDEKEEQNRVKANDLFFLMSSENYDDLGKASLLEEDLKDTYLNSFCKGFRLTNKLINPKFLNYLLSGNIYRKLLSIQGNGFTRINLRLEKLNELKLLLPNLREQQQIANFLDKATAKIDTLIEKQTKQIELLKEKRQAVISQAVTKGINPNVKMKDSGVEWLGVIPEHWGTSPLKFLISEPLMYGANESADRDNPNDPRYIRITDIKKDGTLHEHTFKSLPIEIAKPYLLKENSLLLTRTGATVGKSFLYEISWGVACFAGYLIKAVISPNKALSKYVYYFTNTHNYWQWLKSSQIQATIENVSAEKYSSLSLPVPSLAEQRQIVEYIDDKTSKIDILIEKSNKSIELLKEKRTALISAAVTGKIDVREFE